MKKPRFHPLFALCAACALLTALTLPGRCAPLAPGTMLHARQVLERYGAQGESILQYLETWTDGARAVQREIAETGEALRYAYPGPDGLAGWAPDLPVSGGEPDAQTPQPPFLPDYAALKTQFTLETIVEGQEYAGRACFVSLLENPADEDAWVKLYVDSETGFVLYLDAPLFRLRTAFFEVMPIDEALLTPPQGVTPVR